MKRTLTLLLLFVSTSAVQAQLSSSQKLYYLCKVWGYLKYHHPANCSVNWNELLRSRVDSVVASPDDNAFNQMLHRMCLLTGVTSRPATPVAIAGDSAKNYDISWFAAAPLSAPVRSFLDSVHAHRIPNSSGCLLRLNDQATPGYNSFIDFRRDSINNIPGFSYTNRSHRMLVYFYYWNTIAYLFPQIQIADHSWDSTLIQHMPDMMAAATDSAFELTLARVAARIDDSHGTYSGRYFLKFLTGADVSTQAIHRSRLRIARVEQKHVVIASGEPGIKMGDIITRIDGLDADTFFARWRPYMSASNEITRYRNMYSFLQYGPLNRVRRLEVVDAANVTRQVDLYASTTFSQYDAWFTSSVDTLPEWSLTKCNYGYVHMGKLLRTNVSLMYNDLLTRPAIIFDLRNYPDGTLWSLKQKLFSGPQVSAMYFEPDLSSPGYYYTRSDINNFGNWNNNTPYPGKVIILVNEQTQSQAEYTAQALRTFPRATIIGSQTAGADGNIAYLDLPNGIRTYWSSLGWYQADWYNPQRAGVRVDSTVTLTLAGVRAGVDVVLRKAYDCALAVEPELTLAPFVVSQQGLILHIRSSGQAPFEADMINMTGQRVHRSDSHHTSELRIGMEEFAPGTYILLLRDATGASHIAKVLRP